MSKDIRDAINEELEFASGAGFVVNKLSMIKGAQTINIPENQNRYILIELCKVEKADG